MTPWFWYRVYAQEGQRLLVRAVDGFDAKHLASLRWRRAGITVSNLEVRRATPEEIETHLVSIASFESLGRDHLLSRAVLWPRRAAGGGR